jgi:hypothetical protein
MENVEKISLQKGVRKRKYIKNGYENEITQEKPCSSTMKRKDYSQREFCHEIVKNLAIKMYLRGKAPHWI